MIRERVNAGIARAKAGGKHCGRPFIDTKLEGRIRDALAAPGRPGLHKIAQQFSVGTGTQGRPSVRSSWPSAFVALAALYWSSRRP
jgi:hypothetical protein